MQVKSIAECSLSLRSLFCLFSSGRFTQFLLYRKSAPSLFQVRYQISGSSGEMTLAQRRASLSRGASSDSNYSLDVGRMLSRDQTMNQSDQQDEAQRVKQECQTLKLQVHG